MNGSSENVIFNPDGAGKWEIQLRGELKDVPTDIFQSPTPWKNLWGEPILVGAVNHAEFFVHDEITPVFIKIKPKGRPTIIVGERSPHLVGGVNFRDIGGYRTVDGKYTNWGQVYRSGHLSNLTSIDKEKIEQRGIRTIIDFRSLEESSNEKTDPLKDTRLCVIGIPPGIGDKRYFHRLFASNVEPAPILEAMHHMFVALIRDYATYFQAFFKILLEDSDGALLLNCSAGKERTGTGVALFLSALDVPIATIMYDFMLSERYYPIESEIPRALEKYEVSLPGPEGRRLIMPLLETRRSYIEVIFDTIVNDHGSVSSFLEEKCGVGVNEKRRLRELYTNCTV